MPSLLPRPADDRSSPLRHLPVRPRRTPALDVAEAWELVTATASGLPARDWTPVPDGSLETPLRAPEHGFAAHVLRDTSVPGTDSDPPAHVIVFRETGPTQGLDWWPGFRALLRNELPMRHQLAHAVAFEVRVRWGIRVHLVGSGRGGSLAAFAGLATGTPTTTFDAPGLPFQVRRRLGVLVRLNRHLVRCARPAPGRVAWITPRAR